MKINDVDFRLTNDPGTYLREESTDEDFILVKARHMVERAADLAAHHRTDKIFEMGVLHGGSVVLHDQLFRPSRLVAIDFTSKPVKPLDDYIARRGRSEAVKVFYGVDQSDRKVIDALLSAQFPGKDIDLICDDASHYYEETRAAFNICFPYLAPNGLYVIEDWGWAHWTGNYWQTRPLSIASRLAASLRRRLGMGQNTNHSPFSTKKALSNLLVELLVLSASRPDLIENLFIDHNMVIIRKGPGILPPGNFDIGEHCLYRGKKFRPWI